MSRPAVLRAVAVLVGMAFVAGTSPCLAQPRRDAATDAHTRSAELKKRGDELLDAKRYPEALDAYDAAYVEEPNPALLYNRGRALQFLARYPEALAAIERFAAEAPKDLLARVPGLPRLLEDLRARVGTLVLTSAVPGARVLVNARQIGVTPVAGPLAVDAGHLVVDAFADGYFPFHREIDLQGGDRAAVDLALVSRETSGILVVRSHVDGARVAVDGTLTGTSPLEAGLLAGAHRVVADKPGYATAMTQVVLGAGEKRDLWLDPIESHPAFYTRWWFLTAVGVVIVGGVVTYVALTTEKSPQAGDWAPGLVHF